MIDQEFIFDNNFFKGLKYIVEVLSYLTAPVILYLAYRGLEQIKLAKKESKLNSKREAFKVSAEQCKDYQERIIPLQNKLFDKEATKNVRFFKDSKVEITNKKIKIEFAEDDSELIIDECLLVINSMEAFSLFFISGLGNEKMAFETIGETYVFTVESLLPFLMRYGNNKRFRNILALFSVWYQRREKRILELEKKSLDEKLEKTKTVGIKHLGE